MAQRGYPYMAYTQIIFSEIHVWKIPHAANDKKKKSNKRVDRQNEQYAM